MVGAVWPEWVCVRFVYASRCLGVRGELPGSGGVQSFAYLGGIEAGEGRYVFGIKADAGHENRAGYVGPDRVVWGTALGLSNLLE